MPRLKPGDKPLTPEEDAIIEAAIRDDPDTFELDAEWFAGARPAVQTLPRDVLKPDTGGESHQWPALASTATSG